MKICFVTDTYYPHLTGVAVSVEQFYKGLKKLGHKVSLFAPKIRGYRDRDTTIIRLPSLKVWPTLPDQATIPILRPSRSWKKLWNYQGDIIHAHGGGGYSLIALLVARKQTTSCILTFHTDWAKYNQYILKGVIHPKSINNLLKHFCNRFDGIITPSEKTKQLMIEIGVTKPVLVVPTFIDFKKFNQKPTGFLHKMCLIPADSLILLSVGRLGKEKNFDFLIDVFASVHQKNTNAHLVIVGDGTYQESLQNHIEKLNLAEFVHLTGLIEQEDMPKVYADSDLFVFASVSETQGLTVLEAAATGLPLILVNDRAFDGVIINDQNGYSFPLNKKLFKEKILFLINNSDIRKKMAQSSRQIVQKNFDQEKILKDLIRFYEEIISLKVHAN